jgi:cysteine desulfurase
MNGYFDHNATTPLHPAARAAWLETADRFWQNPSSLYREAGAARQKLEDCREQVADRLGCGAEEIIFLSGATEANNAVVAHAAACGIGSIAVSAIEHPCLLEPAGHLFRDRLTEIPVTPGGVIELEALDKILTTQRPGLVAVMAANNETGVLQPWQEALALCRKQGALFHCDAAQWIGKKPSDGLGACDFLTGSAHKFGGPKGIGFLKVPEGGRPFRSLRGGPQEERRRAGTENLPAVAAMLAAWEAVESDLASREQDRLAARQAFENEIQTALPGLTVIAESSPRLWNTVLLAVPPPVNVKWLTRLSARGFAVSTGSACSRGVGASDILRAMGLPENQSGQVLRLSSGWDTTTGDWLDLAKAIAAVSAGLSDPTCRPSGPTAALDP